MKASVASASRAKPLLFLIVLGAQWTKALPLGLVYLGWLLAKV